MHARYLLVDISNSFTKAVWSDGQSLGPLKRVPTSSLSPALIRTWTKPAALQGVVLCSVVPSKTTLFAQASRLPVKRVNARMDLGIGIDYPKPSQIGPDRLANAVAAYALYGGPAIVVDFGTAVTFDIVSRDGNYLGGVIAPGLRAMTDYLHESTALLPRITLRDPSAAIGKSTREAMLVGAVYGYVGLVKEIIHRVKTEAFGNVRPKVLATGGDAALLARHCSFFDQVDPLLTLRGLRVLANRVFFPSSQ